MKRFITALFIFTLMLSSLTGCRKDIPTKATEQAIDYSTFSVQFGVALASLSDFTYQELPRVALDESDEIVHPSVITDGLAGKTYHLQVYCGEDGEINSIFLTANNEASTKIQFAIFALYVYEALDLPEIESDDFYETFNLISYDQMVNENISGWDITNLRTENILTFHVQRADS